MPLRVVIRDGLEQASLRRVADEAQLNIGSLRHYFASHQELMLFAMRSMLDRVSARLQQRIDGVTTAQLSAAQRHELVVVLLEELLPLDEQRRAEVTVWLEFGTAARTDPALRAAAHESAAGIRTLIGKALTRMAQGGDVFPDFDVHDETERLASLIDGLSLNAVLHPELLSVAGCRAALHGHLDSLTSSSDGTAGQTHR